MMKVANFLGWPPKNLKDAVFPVSLMNWISGLNVVECPIGHPRPILSLIYLMTMIFLYYYIQFTNENLFCNSETIPKAGQMLFNIIWYYNGFVGLALITISWYYQKVIQLCIRRIDLIDASLECFGLPNNHGKIYLRLLLTLFVAFIGLCCVIATDILWYLRETDLQQSIYCSYSYELPIIFQLINDLGFGTIITCIGFSFKNINALLQKGVHSNLALEKTRLNYKKCKIRILPAEFNFTIVDKSRNLIQLVKHQHLELSKVAWEVNSAYGLQIAMSMVANITLVIGNAYDLYVSFTSDFGNDQSGYREMLIINGMCWCILYISRVLYVNSICAKVTAEAHKAEELIFCVNKNNHDLELRKEIEQFSLQLTQRPFFFSMYGLTSLDYSFVAKFLGTVITYLIIVIQIEPKSSKGNITEATTEIFTALTTQIS